jgi:Fe-S-cluster containining protein
MFPCTKCGLCCQNIKGIEQLKDFALESGVCKYYDFDSKECKIYENRPEVCRVDKMYKYYKNKYSKEEYYKANAKVCNMLQEQVNMDISYRVKIGG